jgi:NAD(P)-dependent dehydrogenase (short-subunit alcohol dehydrogenase family)
MKKDLAGTRAAVVGATGGIGKAVVREFAGRGAAVLAVGRSGERLATVEGAAHTLMLDVGDSDSGERLAAELARQLGGVDALVIAVGAIGPIGPTRSVDPDAVLESFRLGPVAALRLVQACAPVLDESLSPSVTLFSGGGATDSFPRYTAYALEKTAIVRLVENLAVEEPEWRVNAVSPGFVATEIHAATLAAGENAVGAGYFEETQRRLAGAAVPPTHAAELCAFLASPASAGISGRVISAVWDPWREAVGQERLRSAGSYGRLRRIDDQWYAEVIDDS